MTAQPPEDQTHETEIMDDEQITEGPTEPGDRPWRQRLGVAQGWQTLVAGIEKNWPDAGLGAEALSQYRDDPDGLVEAVADATDQEPDAVEHELDRLSQTGTPPGS